LHTLSNIKKPQATFSSGLGSLIASLNKHLLVSSVGSYLWIAGRFEPFLKSV